MAERETGALFGTAGELGAMAADPPQAAWRRAALSRLDAAARRSAAAEDLRLPASAVLTEPGRQRRI